MSFEILDNFVTGMLSGEIKKIDYEIMLKTVRDEIDEWKEDKEILKRYEERDRLNQVMIKELKATVDELLEERKKWRKK